MITLPAAAVAMILEHVATCQCRYVADPATTNDVKLIDARCVGSYLVPEPEDPA